MNRTLNLRKRRGERLDEWQATLKRIKEDDQRRSADDTRKSIVAYFELAKEDGITAERISLLCPISNKRVAEPARGVDCTHFACFDLATFLELQSVTPNWDCPFSTCKKKLSCSTVVIDEYIARVLSEVDHLVEKIELLPSGAWNPVEVEHGATGSTNGLDNGDDIQVVQENLATRNQREVAVRTVSVCVLEELHRQIGDVLEQFNGLGYKRLGGISASLADLNIFVKQQIRAAKEPATITRTAPSVSSTSAKPVATQTPSAPATQDASSQTSPPEPSKDIVADSPSLASNVVLIHSQRDSTKPFGRANADADLQPLHHATPRDSTVATANRRIPDDVDESKPLRDEGVSTALQLRMLLRRQLAVETKQRSGTNMPDPTSASPSLASSQPVLLSDSLTVTAQEGGTDGGSAETANGLPEHQDHDYALVGNSRPRESNKDKREPAIPTIPPLEQYFGEHAARDPIMPANVKYLSVRQPGAQRHRINLSWYRRTCSMFTKRLEPGRKSDKPEPVNYKQFIRKLSMVLETQLRRSTYPKETDAVVLSTLQYVCSWARIVRQRSLNAVEKSASSLSDDQQVSCHKQSESPAGHVGPSQPVVTQTASSMPKPAPH